MEFDNFVECRYVWQLQVISQKAATILGSHYDVSTRICDVSLLTWKDYHCFIALLAFRPHFKSDKSLESSYVIFPGK